MPDSLEAFTYGLERFSRISAADRKWVTARIIQGLSNGEAVALDDLIAALSAAREAIRSGVSVFLSHSSRDKRFVRQLAQYLRSHGIKVWLDEADLLAGDTLLTRLNDAVDKTSLLLVVLSRNSVSSTWVKKELSMAKARKLAKRRVKIIPIVKDMCKIPTPLRGKLYLDFTTAAARSKNRPILIDAIMRQAMRYADYDAETFLL